MSARDELAREAPEVAEALTKDTEELARKVQQLLYREQQKLRDRVRTEERGYLRDHASVLVIRKLLDAHDEDPVFTEGVDEALRGWLEAPGFRGALVIHGHRVYPPSTENL